MKGRGQLQIIQNEKNNLLDILLARLAKDTNAQRMEMIDSIHPKILDRMLKRAQEVNAARSSVRQPNHHQLAAVATRASPK